MALTSEVRGSLLEKWLEEKGVRFHYGRTGWQKVSCYGPGHFSGDRNPSASINLSTGYYKCFGCDLEGDAVDLLMQEEGLDFKGALAKLGVQQGKVEEPPEWI